MTCIACTLTEGRYEYGAGALFNSLVAAGFNGAFCVGYRGERPFRRFAGIDSLDKLTGVAIHFHEINGPRRLQYYKPSFMLDLIARWSPDRIYYFDADIVVLTRWRFFEEWVDFGVALAQDVVWYDMHETHPIKGQWRRILAEAGFPSRPFRGYANSGFIGLRPEQALLLERWRDLIELRPSLGFAYHEVDGDISRPIQTFDQDLLNMAIIGTEVPLALAGLEGMAMKTGKAYMAHANSGPKPWQPGLLAAALRGHRPSPAYKAFWHFCRSPLRIHSDRRLQAERWRILAARLLARMCAR